MIKRLFQQEIEVLISIAWVAALAMWLWVLS